MEHKKSRAGGPAGAVERKTSLYSMKPARITQGLP
jgi:hypothetical protein